MKNSFFILALLSLQSIFAQEHFAGINTTRRVGLLNANFNPAELTNMNDSFEFNLFNTSLNISNNKISFQDIVKGEDIEALIFDGNEAANMRLDLLVNGPSFAFKNNKWAFGVFSNANVKANIIDVDVNLGDALINSGLNAGLGTTTISGDYNQKINAASWAELGFTLSRSLLETEKFKLNAGANIRLLFPSAYANLSLQKFNGQVVNTLTEHYLTNTSASLNIAYAGPLADGFTDAENFNEFFSSGINGYAADFGLNFRITNEDCKNGDYLLNAGAAVRNIGSMTFKSENNESTNYNLNIPNGQKLDLVQFQDVDDVKQIEQILLSSGYLTNPSTESDFEIKLPTVFSAYADLKIYHKFHVSAYTQQKLNDDSENEFTTTQNSFTITPRLTSRDYEIYVPISSNEISGFATGFGLRLGGFFLGSGSIITAAMDDTKQADIYVGFRAAF